MAVQLLPTYAAAFEPRPPRVQVVLGDEVDGWLTDTLKRVSSKRTLNNVRQHRERLQQILSHQNATWTLSSLHIPEYPLELKAYIVHVDMAFCNEVAFKLTEDTIQALIDVHGKIHCTDQARKTYHEEFVQAINRFVYRTRARVLSEMREDWRGTLPADKGKEVQSRVLALLNPVLTPPVIAADQQYRARMVNRQILPWPQNGIIHSNSFGNETSCGDMIVEQGLLHHAYEDFSPLMTTDPFSSPAPAMPAMVTRSEATPLPSTLVGYRLANPGWGPMQEFHGYPEIRYHPELQPLFYQGHIPWHRHAAGLAYRFA